MEFIGQLITHKQVDYMYNDVRTLRGHAMAMHAEKIGQREYPVEIKLSRIFKDSENHC